VLRFVVGIFLLLISYDEGEVINQVKKEKLVFRLYRHINHSYFEAFWNLVKPVVGLFEHKKT